MYNAIISVIIPVKNRADLLRITLKNILGQTRKPDEVIVVDDASTDHIKEVAAEFAGSVTFLACTGSGPGAARNTGLRVAKGQMIQFFDSDDLMTPNKLKVQSDLMIRKNADVVYGPFVKAVEKNGEWEQKDIIMQYYPLPNGRLSDFVLQGWCNLTQSVLFSRAVLDRAGFMREDITTHEDYEYWFRVGKEAKVIVHENESCTIYRQHLNQITDQDLSVKRRWMEGIIAREKIAEGLNYKPSLQSLMLFKGNSAMSKMGYASKFGNEKAVNVKMYDKVFVPYYKLSQKFGRRKTNTDWQVMHGPSSSKEVFKHYIKLLNS